jgi:hypothetical protein
LFGENNKVQDISILKEMFKDSATVPLEEHPHDSTKKLVKLAELGSSAGYSITIHGMPDDAESIVIKADGFISPQAVFAGSKGECKRADFVIIVNSAKSKAIVCIELKARNTTSTEQDIIQQLKGARCFIAYSQEIGKFFWGKKDFLDDYKDRYVSIRNISISKKPTRLPPKTGMHDRPERMLKISAPHYLQLNELIGAH